MLGSDNSKSSADRKKGKRGADEKLASPGQVNPLNEPLKGLVKGLWAEEKERHQRKESCFTWQQKPVGSWPT